MSDELICVVAICKTCRKSVIYKYTKSGNTNAPIGSGVFTVLTSGMPMGNAVNGRWSDKPDVEWCDCGSDEPRHLCKVKNEELPGLEDKCAECEYRFSCASSRIEVVYNGTK